VIDNWCIQNKSKIPIRNYVSRDISKELMKIHAGCYLQNKLGQATYYNE
jgi:hypothetical protein